MAYRPRAVQVAILFVVVTLVIVVAIPATLAQERFTLAKQVTYPTGSGANVGDKVSITLTIKNVGIQAATVKVTDPNPDPAAVKIDPASVQGATYVASGPGTRERVEWMGELLPGGTKTITFKTEALVGGAGRIVTNEARLVDVNSPQSVPEKTAAANIVIKPGPPVLEPIDNADEDGAYTLNWSKATGSSNYIVEEADNSSFTKAKTIYSGSGMQHEVTGQVPGRWYYRVRAVSGPILSDWSNTESTSVVVSTPDLLPIDNPFSEASYLVKWNSVTGATGYTLQEDDNSQFSDPTTYDELSENQYGVTGQPNGLWYYRVRAEGPTGPSGWSAVRSTKVGGPVARIAYLPVVRRGWPPPPETPDLTPIENPDGDGAFAVQWSAADRAVDYVLEEAKDTAFQLRENRYETTSTSYSITGRGASRLFYRVKARNFTGESSWSNVEQVDVLWHLEGKGGNPENEERQTNGSVISGLTYFGTFLNQVDVSDYFYVDIPAARTIELNLRNIPSGHNWDLALRDFDLFTYDGWYSVRSGNQDENVKVTVPAGRYYIQVYNNSGPGSNQPYHLAVKITAP